MESEQELDKILEQNLVVGKNDESHSYVVGKPQAKTALLNWRDRETKKAKASELQKLAAFFLEHHLFDQDAAMKLNYHITERLTELTKKGKDE